MRVLHTSDWHLGRSLHRADLRGAQEAVLDALVATVRGERVDVVVVAGDVYDRAVPPLDAVRLFEDGLVRLRDAGARVIVCSGNHDSAVRLGFGSRLVEQAGVFLRTRPQRLAEPVVLDDRHGPVGFYPIPYLEPDAVRGALPPLADPGASATDLADPADAIDLASPTDAAAGPLDPGDPVDPGEQPAGPPREHAGVDPAAGPGEQPVEPPRGHAGVLGHAAACIAADARARGLARTVVAAHAWVVGGLASDSERDITVGGVGCVPAEPFAGFSYTALGHLHGPQTIGEGIRYSGSPLPYSFSEAGQVKGWWLVELGPAGLDRVEQLPAPVYRRLSVLRGPLADLLASREYAPAERDFVSVTLTDPARPVEAMERLRTRFPHVLTVAWEPAGVAAAAGSYASRVRGRDDLSVAGAFVRHVRGTDTSAAELALLGEAVQAARCRHDGEPGSAPPAPAQTGAGRGV